VPWQCRSSRAHRGRPAAGCVGRAGPAGWRTSRGWTAGRERRRRTGGTGRSAADVDAAAAGGRRRSRAGDGDGDASTTRQAETPSSSLACASDDCRATRDRTLHAPVNTINLPVFTCTCACLSVCSVNRVTQKLMIKSLRNFIGWLDTIQGPIDQILVVIRI